VFVYQNITWGGAQGTTWEVEAEGSQLCPGKVKKTLSTTNTGLEEWLKWSSAYSQKKKKTGEVAQVVSCLARLLGSIPSTTQNKPKNKNHITLHL
jgi:hypothetical protein